VASFFCVSNASVTFKGYTFSMKSKACEEGQKAREHFERTMTALFKIKKNELAEKIKKKPKKGKDYAAFRCPRPCLGLMYGVSALTSKFFLVIRRLTKWPITPEKRERSEMRCSLLPPQGFSSKCIHLGCNVSVTLTVPPSLACTPRLATW